MKLLVAILIVIIILCFVSFYCIYSNLIQPLKDENHRCRKEVQDINSYNLKLEQQRKKIEESYYCASEKALELARELSVTKDVVTKQAEEIGLLKTDLTANEGLEDKRQALLNSLTSVQNAIQERNILLHEMDLKIQEETARLDEAHRKEKDSLKAMQTMETRSKEIEAEVNKLIAQQEDLKTRIEDLKSWHRLALQEHNKEEDNLKGVRLELYGREVKMAALLNELKETYGELLASDLANIE